MADNEIGLQAIFENEQFQQGIAEYNSSVKDASSNTESGASTMSAAWSGLSAVGAIAFTAIGAGIAALTAELYLAVDAAMETEQVMARMEFVVGNVGDRTGVTAEDVLALADSLSQVLPIDDEVITSAITMGLTFDGVTKDNIEPLIAAAADLAAWTGKDLPATMRELSMAISDPDKAMRLLRDANITLTDAEMKTLKAFKVFISASVRVIFASRKSRMALSGSEIAIDSSFIVAGKSLPVHVARSAAAAINGSILSFVTPSKVNPIVIADVIISSSIGRI